MARRVVEWLLARLRRAALVLGPGFHPMKRLLLLLPWIAVVAGATPATPEKPQPHFANVAYGEHARQVLDLWIAPAAEKAPTPLVIFIHGGGFVSSDKSIITPEMLLGLLGQGYSVAAINYRYCGPGVPLPGPMRDAGRALQFLRANAAKFRLDPKRVALCGGSAGAGIALWLNFHDDLAQPDSADPIARESTRVSCTFVWGAQTSYDLRFIKQHVGGRLAEIDLAPIIFQLPREELYTEKAFALFREVSPYDHVTAGDPPVFLYYDDPLTPLEPDSPPEKGIHHPAFGPPMNEKVDAVGGYCLLRHKDEYAIKGGNYPAEFLSFLQRFL